MHYRPLSKAVKHTSVTAPNNLPDIYCLVGDRKVYWPQKPSSSSPHKDVHLSGGRYITRVRQQKRVLVVVSSLQPVNLTTLLAL